MKSKSVFFALSFFGGILFAGLVFGLAWSTRAAENRQEPTRQLLASDSSVGTGFTYQGYLDNGGEPATGLYDFRFRLYEAVISGTQVGVTVTLSNVPIFDGQFSVKLDFGQSAFGGGARWLEVDVRQGGSTVEYFTLSPRQELTPAPYAQALPNVYTDETSNFVGIGRDFRISGNELFGVRYVGGANVYGGMYVETSHAQGWPFYGYATNGSFRAWTYYNGTNGDWHLYNAGIRLTVPNEGGLRIGPSADYSLVISNTTGSDGVRIYDTGDDGIQIGNNPDYPNYGLYIPSPGATSYGLWPNTQNGSGEWALYTVDNIQAGNVVANAYSLIAKVTGPDALTVGDIVAVTGVAEPIPGSTNPLPYVRLADEAEFTGVIGVVENRMVYELAPGKEAEGAMSMHSADGPAQPGEYVSIILYGVAQVKVDPKSNIHPGDRLTVSGIAGSVRTLKTETLNGMIVTEGAPIIGIALAAPVEGQEMILVFITLR